MLSIRGLKTHYGPIQALRDVSLDVSEGSVTALIGPNGAGKSTLINTISGVLKPTGGSVRFRGQEIGGLRGHVIARQGLIQVPEGRQVLAPLSVLENLQLGRQALGSRAAVTRDLDDVFDLFPRLAERLSQRAGSLSGGEQQMLAIGRALMGRPGMLLLDEPSLGLAPIVVSQVFSAIRRLNEHGMTLLIVEQNASRALDVSNEAYVLERGRIVTSGRSATLRDDPAIRSSYLGAYV